jgi:proteasome assembly chaperone (PAC2) family protein
MISYIIIIGVLLLGIALDFWLDHRRYKKVMKTVLEETLEVEDSMKKIKKKAKQ